MPIVTNRLEPGQRPGMEHTKGVFVLDGLDTLRGPSNAVVSLPKTINWTPANKYDLTDRRAVKAMYEVVLREARKPEDIQPYVNRDLLRRVWRSLFLLPYVRDAWEAHNPELRSC